MRIPTADAVGYYLRPLSGPRGSLPDGPHPGVRLRLMPHRAVAVASHQRKKG